MKLGPTRLILSVTAALGIALLLPLLGCSGRLGEALELERQGDLAGAVRAYEEVLAVDPDNPEALVGISTDLLLLQRYDEALEYQERAIAADPHDVQTRIELGFNYLNHQDDALRAVKALTDAASQQPTGRNLGFLAQAQAASDDVRGAEATLRQAMELDPAYGRTYDLLIGLLRLGGREVEADAVKDLAALRGVRLEGTR